MLQLPGISAVRFDVHSLEHRSPMTIRLLLPAAALCLALCAPAAPAATYAGGRVIVRYEDGLSRAERAGVQRDTGTGFDDALPGGARTLAIEDGESVAETVAELEDEPGVADAAPDFVISKAQAPAPF